MLDDDKLKVKAFVHAIYHDNLRTLAHFEGALGCNSVPDSLDIFYKNGGDSYNEYKATKISKFANYLRFIADTLENC